MKPRSKTSRKPLKKKQNGKISTKKNTKKHKQTHKARRKRDVFCLGGGEAADGAQVGLLSNEEIYAQKEAEFYPLSPGALKASGKLVVMGGGVIGLIALFVITRN